MRVLPQPTSRLGNAHEDQQVDRPLHRFGFAQVEVETHRLGELNSDAAHGIERCHRILEDHRELGAEHLLPLGRRQGENVTPGQSKCLP